MRLITIPMSHYCEKARWALSHAGVDFVEEAHLQVFHYAAARVGREHPACRGRAYSCSLQARVGASSLVAVILW